MFPQPRPSLAVAFRLLLMAMLWDGPVIWGHQHAARAEGLSEHLARYHADDQNSTCLGWHWHVSPPVNNGSQPTDGEEPETRYQPKTLAEPVVLSGLFQCVAAVPCLDVPVVCKLRCSADALFLAAGNYMATFSPGHSAQQMLCRLSC